MNSFKLKVLSPDGPVFDDDAVILSLRGIEGDLAIMAGHVPFITSVKKGECKIELPDGTDKIALTDGGLLTVASDKTVFLSDSFRWK